jgi:arylsulfatase A-like enzyme
MPGVPSPNLQRLADSGLVFDRAFATSPLCTPARSSLFTGTSPHRNGLLGLSHAGWRYAEGVRTLPELARDAGYRTTLIGLQHEDPDPTVLGFDEVRGLGFLPRALPVAIETAAFFAEMPSQTPHLVTIGMWEVHRPWPEEDYRAVDPGAVTVPPFLPDNDHTREDIAGFYGAIAQMDRAVGIILDAIDQHLDPEHTLVVFTTDHGAAFPRAKGTLYDPGVQVALIARTPRGWTAPGRIAAMVSHLDIVPTVLDLAGAPIPAHLEGRSLRPELTGVPAGDEPSGRTLFLQKTFHDGYDPIRAVRTDRFKYIRNFRPGPRLALSKDLEESATRQGMNDEHLAARPAEELYDLVADRWESDNLAGRPQWRDVQADLAGRLSGWMRDTADPVLNGEVQPPPLPRRQPNPPPAPIPVPDRVEGHQPDPARRPADGARPAAALHRSGG